MVTLGGMRQCWRRKQQLNNALMVASNNGYSAIVILIVAEIKITTDKFDLLWAYFIALTGIIIACVRVQVIQTIAHKYTQHVDMFTLCLLLVVDFFSAVLKYTYNAHSIAPIDFCCRHIQRILYSVAFTTLIYTHICIKGVWIRDIFRKQKID